MSVLWLILLATLTFFALPFICLILTLICNAVLAFYAAFWQWVFEAASKLQRPKT
jgi:hypothetical protein